MKKKAGIIEEPWEEGAATSEDVKTDYICDDEQGALEERAFHEEVLAEEEYIPSIEEVNNALMYDLRDKWFTFTVEQKEFVKNLVFDASQTTAKERLYQEAVELREKIDRLENFLRKRNEDGIKIIETLKLTEAAIYLLCEQLETMKKYYNILCARYSIFDVKSEENHEVK